MKKITDEISLRPLQPDEENYWREVFFDSVGGRFSALGMSGEQLNSLLEFQFQAQNTDYRTNYKKASNDVILFNDERAGRLIYSTEHSDLHIVDLAILSAFRNRGISTKILQWFFKQSRQSGLPVRLYVEKLNPAFKLYERLGFKIAADVNSHFQLEWRASEQKKSA